MAQPQMLQIKLSRFDAQPWGFRLQGGVDFAAPLLVQKVNGGSLAEQAGLQPGDAVLMINDVDVFNLKHKDAQDIVVRSGNNFVMTIQRGGSTWKPHVTPTGNLPQPNSPYLQTVTKTSLAHHQPDSQHIGCGYNNSARPFANGGGDGNVKSIVNKQYNTPVGIYSEESIAETLSAQAEVLAGGVLGVNFKKNEKEYQADKSEVLKFLREEESGQSSTPAFISEDPTQQEAHYQQKQQQQYQQQQQHQHQPQHQYQPQQQQQNYQQQQQYQPQQQQQQQYQQQQNYQQQQSSATRHVSAPVNTPKPPSTGGLPTGQNICTECERLITGVFVRIKDKNLHVECFRCATCGTSLKNQGYYNFNNKLYCDVHAKLAALQNPPSGTDGYVPVPIKPNTKLSANTISSALNAHGYNNGISNGNSTPTPAPQEDLTDLPLPPPPSPTQLQEYENESQLMYTNNNNNNTVNSYNIPNNSIQNSHTRTNSSLSTMSSNSAGTSSASMSPIPPAQQNENLVFRHNLNNHNNNNSMSGASTLSLDHSYGSPMHSREASSSSSSLLGSGGSYDYEQSKSVPLPPPPPPPMPNSEPQQPLYINAIKTKTENNQRNIKMLQQQQQQQNAENDMNVQNKNVAATNTVLTSAPPAITAIPTNNAYNKLLKEYSNKLLTQNGSTTTGQQHHTQDTNNTTTQNAAAMPMKEITHIENNNSSSHNNNNLKNQMNNNGKSFSGIAARTFTPQQIAAASAATLATSVLNSSQLPAATTKNANPLKFNSKQVSANKFAPPPALPTTTFPPAPTPATPLLEQIDCINTAAANSLNSNIKSNSSHQLDNMSMSMLDSDYQQQQQQQQQQEQSIYGQINVQNQINNFNAGQQGGQSSSDQPFEYVTLTGNVIRSVVPPGKGVNINYKVNQGYARPFGASAGGPPAGAPKSPMSYPPQQQQQQQQQWNQPQPAGNNYATLPRAAAGGQQAPNNPSTNTNTELNNATLPRKPGPLNKPMKLVEHQPQVPDTADNATAMLTESLSKLDVDNKMGQNFMAEAGKIISNMLEARLAGNQQSGGGNTLGQSLSHGGSAQSMHSNNSGSTRSPMVVRKRLDLDDFKNLDPTKPVALHPVVVANVTPHLNATADQSFKSNAQIAQPQQKSKTNGQSLTNEMPNNHAMGKLLDMCDNKPTLLKKPTTPLANSNNNKMPVFQPIRKDIVQPKPIAMPLKDVKVETSATEAAMHSPVVLRQTGRGNGERSTHAIDRRSYIEAPPSTATSNNNTVLRPQAPTAQPQALAQAQTPPKPAQPKPNNDNAPAFCVSVKALNGQDENTPMSAENEQVVSQFLKDGKKPICCQCDKEITSGPFITALGRIWCPDHFICVNGNCRRPLQDIGFVEEKGDLYCEYCFEKYLAPTCSKCNGKIKGDCLNAIGRHFHPECFSCTHCGKVFGNSPFFLEEGNPYCEADWNELFTTKCFACGFPVEAGDRWVEALNHNYHSQCFNCTFCKQNLEGQSFYNKGGRPFCKNHAR